MSDTWSIQTVPCPSKATTKRAFGSVASGRSVNVYFVQSPATFVIRADA